MRDAHAWQVRECDPASLPLDLLLQADPSEKKVRAYLGSGSGFVVESDGHVVGLCVLLPRAGNSVEIMNVSVAPSHQRQGIGLALLHHVITFARDQGLQRLEVGTGSFGHQFAFYQKAGFRVTAIERNYFTQHYPVPIIEDGIRLRDMLRLELALDPHA